MNNHLINFLSDEDFYLDNLGRIIIDDDDLLAAVKGAMSSNSIIEDMLCNTGCVNGAC